MKQVPEVLADLAADAPDRVAFVMLDKNFVETPLTYGELYRRSRRIAHRLEEALPEGEPVLLLQPHGLSFIVTFCACLLSGNPAVPIRPVSKRNRNTLVAIAHDAGTRTVLSTPRIKSSSEGFLAETIPDALWLVESEIGEESDGGPAGVPGSWWAGAAGGAGAASQPAALEDEALERFPAARGLGRSGLAFLQYTSGSTGEPRGVMVSHESLAENLALSTRLYGYDASDVGCSWLPLYHDMGLIGFVLGTLYTGSRSYLMTPDDFIRRPLMWLEALSRYGCTVTGSPNFGLEHCLDALPSSGSERLDLSQLKVAIIGAEPVSLTVLKRFHAAFAGCGLRSDVFFPSYGMAEATLCIASERLDVRSDRRPMSFDPLELAQGRIRELSGGYDCVPHGEAPAGTAICIVDPETLEPAAEGTIGEICARGPQIASGYWNKPRESAETFGAQIGGEAYLRTGDLGFLHRGQLYISGRLKDVIIIRGTNHFPQDIEATVVGAHPAVQPFGVAAFQQGKSLAVAVEVRRDSAGDGDEQWEEMGAAVRSAVSEAHGVAVSRIVFTRPHALPKTTSGKIRRRETRQLAEKGMLPVLHEWVSEGAGSDGRGGAANTTGGNRAARRRALGARLEGAGGTGVGPRGGRDETLTVDAMIAWLREYAPRRIDPVLNDERRTIPPHVVLDLGNMGFFGLHVDPSLGGLGLSYRSALRLYKQLGAIDQSIGLFVGLANVLGIRPIDRFARQELREEWLPRLAAGRSLAAFALTEPGAGSNPAAIAATARRRGTAYLLNGEKIWSGSAAWAGVINTFARTPEGVTAFAVPTSTPGVEQGPEALTMGMRAMIQNTVYFRDAEVPESCVLGRPGEGFTVAQDAMMHGRFGIAGGVVGAMRRAIQLAWRYASRRTVNLGVLAEIPLTRERMGSSLLAAEALDAMILRMADDLDRQAGPPEAAYLAAKILAPEFLWQAVDGAAQLLGGRGYIETNLMPQLIRDARVLRVFEGPTETLEAHLGSLVESQGDAIAEWLSALSGSAAGGRLQELRSELVPTRELPVHEHRRRTAYLGHAAAWLILEGFASTAGDDAVVHWVAGGRQAAVRRARDGAAGEEHLLDGGELARRIEGFEAQIGDIEYARPGTIQALDPYLSVAGFGAAGSAAQRETAAQEPRTPRPAGAAAGPGRSSPEGNGRSSAAEEDTAPAKVEAWICEWLARRYSLPSVDPELSVTSYGLDSLASLELAVELGKRLGYEVDPSELWLHPDIATLARAIAFRDGSARAGDGSAAAGDDGASAGHDRARAGEGSAPAHGGAPAHRNGARNASSGAAPGAGGPGEPDFVADVSLVDPLLAAGRIDPPPAGATGQGAIRRLFLTGATGFLGTFLLAELLARSKTRIACLVRAGDAEAARKRLRDSAQRYGLSLDLARVDPVAGDLALPSFGNPELYRRVAAEADTVIHCAAEVDFTRGYRTIRDSTVLGTARILELCLTGAPKRLHYVSSTAVFESPRLAGERVDEACADPPAEGILLGYSQSKWTTERMVLRAASAGLPAVVYRPPLISGHSATGAWNGSDFLIRLLRGVVAMNSVPTIAFDIDAVPVDLVSAAIAVSVAAADAPPILHLTNPRPLPWESLSGLLEEEGFALPAISYEAWLELLRETQTDPASSPLYPFRSFFVRAYDGLTIPQLYRRHSRPRIENELTTAWLRGKGLSIPSVEELMRGPYSRLLAAQER